MRGELATWFERYAEPSRDGRDKGVTGCGQLGPTERGDATHRMFADTHLVGADWDLWVDNGERSHASEPAPVAPVFATNGGKP
jgi:hypothetical protein